MEVTLGAGFSAGFQLQNTWILVLSTAPGRKGRVWTRTSDHTCVLHVVDAHLDKVGHKAVLPLAQAGQTAAKNLICEDQHMKP